MELFHNLVLRHCLGSQNTQENIGRGADSIRILSHHHVGKPNIAASGDQAPRHVDAQTLLVQLNVLQSIDSLVEITRQGAGSQDPNQGEISQHFVQRVMIKAVGLVQQGVEHIQYKVIIPEPLVGQL